MPPPAPPPPRNEALFYGGIIAGVLVLGLVAFILVQGSGQGRKAAASNPNPVSSVFGNSSTPVFTTITSQLAVAKPYEQQTAPPAPMPTLEQQAQPPPVVQPAPAPTPSAASTATPSPVQPTPAPTPAVAPTATLPPVQPAPVPTPAVASTGTPPVVQPTSVPTPSAARTATPPAPSPAPAPVAVDVPEFDPSAALQNCVTQYANGQLSLNQNFANRYQNRTFRYTGLVGRHNDREGLVVFKGGGALPFNWDIQIKARPRDYPIGSRAHIYFKLTAIQHFPFAGWSFRGYEVDRPVASSPPPAAPAPDASTAAPAAY